MWGPRVHQVLRKSPLWKFRQGRLRRRYTNLYAAYARELLGPGVTTTDWFLVKPNKGWHGSRQIGGSAAAMMLFYKDEVRYFAKAWCERGDDDLNLVIAVLLITGVGAPLAFLLWCLEMLSVERPALVIGLAHESGTFGTAEIATTPTSANALMERLRSTSSPIW